MVEKQVVEQEAWVEAEAVAEQITEQSDAVMLAEHDDDDEEDEEDMDEVGLGEL